LRCVTRLCLLLFAGLYSPSFAVAEPLPRSVLVITDSSPYSSGAIAMSMALGSETTVNSVSRIAVYSEHLDLNRFPSPQHRQLVRSYFRDKYRETPIGVLVVDGRAGLDLVLSLRGEIWPEVPLIFFNVDDVSASPSNLPSNVTGFVAKPTFRGMLDAARMLVPGLKQVVLVGDPPERDAYRRHYRQEIAALAAEIEIVDLTGFAVSAVKERVAKLPNDAVVLYTALFVDGAGVVYTPQSALLAISGTTSRPIFIDAESQLGYGAVGGFVFSFVSAARQAARLAVRILDGEKASQIPVISVDLSKPVFDWRQLKRWNIGEDKLPPGSEIRFRELTVWEQYRWPISAALAIVLLQASMIAGLLIERRRRQLAQAESQARRREVAHLNRAATATVLSASIAHEINQPLTAILSNAQTGEYMLKAESPNLHEIGQILADIRQDDNRASEIIRRLRNLLANKIENLQTFDLNDVVREVAGIVSPEAQKRRVVLKVDQAQSALPVRADWIHLQQVMLNLLMNGIDALENCGVRKLTIRTARIDADNAEVLVADSGEGISKDDLRHVFDPFFTTKPNGTGLGLPIARAILETYNGTIRAESQSGGAVFRVTLPLQRSI
jgi:signal transduction histidine kinase